MKFCKISNCDRKSRVLEMCDKHYRRFRICNDLVTTGNDSHWNIIGRERSLEHRQKLSAAKIGKPGTPHTEEHKRYMSQLQQGQHNGMWKGDRVGYKCLHDWVRRHKPIPSNCP